MIRVEIVVKSKWGDHSDDLERKLKREIAMVVSEVLEEQHGEPVRIQFLGPKPTRKS